MTHISGARECVMPECPNPPHPLMRRPLCSRCAKKVYTEVRNLLDTATDYERGQTARPPKMPALVKSGWRTLPGVVYFAQVGEFIKIGWSSNVNQRMRQVGADRLLAAIPGTMKEEEAMHHRFGPSWSHGEYFHPTDDLLRFIESCATT